MTNDHQPIASHIWMCRYKYTFHLKMFETFYFYLHDINAHVFILIFKLLSI